MREPVDNAPQIDSRPRPSSRCYIDGCQWYSLKTSAQGLAAYNAHVALDHSDTVQQLAGVSFQEQYVAAVRALPYGVEFTTADLHGVVPDPPSPAHWGAAQNVAASLGLCRPVDVQRSDLPTTKGSRLLRWVREDVRGRAA